MKQKIYFFNPAHDMALANNTPFYKSPDEISRMAYDLAVLPAWYAGVGGKVKVDELNQADLLASQSPLLPQVHWTCEWENGIYEPWGWDPAVLYQLRSAGVDESVLPDERQMQRIRFLSSRQRCVDILAALRTVEGTCGEAVVCGSEDDVNFYMSEMGEIILKSPWSGSGRGLVRVSSSTWNPSVSGWISRVLRTQGIVMAEPLYEKAVDFAMEFYADGCGEIFFVGYSLFETDSHGNYKENRLLSDEWIEQYLLSFIAPDVLRQIRVKLLVELSSLLGNGYEGYFGVDMMVCRVGDEYRIHPCVEVNLRMNMGLVAHAVFARYLHSQSHGCFRIEYYRQAGNALDVHRTLHEKYPLKMVDGRVLSGYLPLTGVDVDTHYQAYIIVGCQ